MSFGNLKTALTVSTVGFVTLMGSSYVLGRVYPNTDGTNKWYVTALLGSLGLSLGSFGQHYLENSASSSDNTPTVTESTD